MATDRLSPLDVAFLCMEDPTTPMHMGVVATYRPDRPTDAHRLARLVAERAAAMPRLRKRARFGPWPFGGAQWVDDPAFDPRDHVEIRTLNAEGPDALAAHASEWIETPLPLDAPLWRVRIVTGLPDGGFATLVKLHHALSDGLGAVEIGFGLLDPLSRSLPAAPPRPSPGSLRASATQAARTAIESAQIAAALGRATRPPSTSPMRAPNSPRRRVAFAQLPATDLRAIRKKHGGSTNDIALAVLAGALREWLRNSGHSDCARPLNTLIPVSLRGRQPATTSGNQLSGYLCRLPVHVDDPLERLRLVRIDMDANKQAGPARGAGAVPVLADRIPSGLHRIAAGSAARAATALFDTVITNVPVPGVPLSLDGARLKELYPLVPLAPRHLVGIGISGYRDTIHIGLQANGAAVADLGSLTDAITKSLSAMAV